MVKDLGKRDGICEICGAKLRYQHFVSDSNQILRIGVECASNLLGGNELDKTIELDKKAKSDAKKQKKNEQLYAAYLERCKKWNEKHPGEECTPKSFEEIYGG